MHPDLWGAFHIYIYFFLFSFSHFHEEKPLDKIFERVPCIWQMSLLALTSTFKLKSIRFYLLSLTSSQFSLNTLFAYIYNVLISCIQIVHIYRNIHLNQEYSMVVICIQRQQQQRDANLQVLNAWNGQSIVRGQNLW